MKVNEKKLCLDNFTTASGLHSAVILVMLLELEEIVHIRSGYIIGSHISSGSEKVLTLHFLDSSYPLSPA